MYARDLVAAKSLGTIEVKVATAISGVNSLYNARRFDKKESLNVHEKAMKGRDLRHGLSYGPLPSIVVVLADNPESNPGQSGPNTNCHGVY